MSEPAIIPTLDVLPREQVLDHIQERLSLRKAETELKLLTARQTTHEDYLREFFYLAGLRAALEVIAEVRKKYRV